MKCVNRKHLSIHFTEEEKQNMYSTRRTPVSSPNTINSGGVKNNTPPGRLSEAFADIRTKVLQRYGKIGLKAVGQLIRSLDTEGSGFLSADEMRCGLRDGLGVCISDEDFGLIVDACDTEKSKRGDNAASTTVVNIREFIVGLRGTCLSNRRRNVIDQAFKRLDPDQTGYISLATLYSAYDVSRHPDVLARRATSEQAAAKFLADFSQDQHPTVVVTVEEFVNYYIGVSADVSSDEQFELLLIRSFALDRPSNATLAMAAARGSPSGQDGVSSRYNANHGVPPLPRSGTSSLNATGASSSSSPNGTSPRSLGNNTIGVITEDGAIARRDHPLYVTSMMEYGKTASQHRHEPHHHLPGGFTKNAPPFSAGSGLNTATTKSRVI